LNEENKMTKKRKRDKITIKIDNLLGNVKIAKPWHTKHLLSKTGGPMTSSKGKRGYDRKKERKAWKKEHNL
jgi:hypothetical protein